MITSEHKHVATTSDSGTDRAFTLAFILTNNAERAEHIVTTAIDTLPSNDFSEARLLAAVAEVAWTLRNEDVTRHDRIDIAVRMRIPVELRRVLELPKQLRYFFSLRALAGMTVWACAQLTLLEPEQIEYYFQLAVRMLAMATKLTFATNSDHPAPALLFVDGDHAQVCGHAE